MRSWRDHLSDRVGESTEVVPWVGQVPRRLLELDLATSCLPFGHRCARALEIGCGNALGSAYLASQVDTAVATDLPMVNSPTHSMGLGPAKDLLTAVGVDSVQLLGCSGDILPFSNDSFDLVLGLHALEHVPDKASCLREIRRVLRPGGHLLLVVPAAAWAATAPVDYYFRMMQRLVARAMRLVIHRLKGGRHLSTDAVILRRDGTGAREGPAPQHIRTWAQFRQAHPRFPRPEPHGEWPGYLAELRATTPAAWAHLCSEAGWGQVIAQPLAVLPLWLLFWMGERSFELYCRRLFPIDRWLARRSWAMPFAQTICLMAISPQLDQ